MTDDSSPTPYYQQVAAIIRTQIRNGEIEGRVPSVRKLAKTYAVSHVTAARAMQELKSEGLVVSSPGRGYFVRKPGQTRPNRITRIKRKEP